MHSKSFICQSVATWKNYLHLLTNSMHSKFFICKIFTTWKHRERSPFIYGQIECTQSVSFVKVFQFEMTSFIYWSLIALENLELCECFNLQELLTCTLANSMHSKKFSCESFICMSLHELLMFIGQFNAFKELNLLRCFNLR
jgi:hypothetical protein